MTEGKGNGKEEETGRKWRQSRMAKGENEHRRRQRREKK